MTRNLGLISLYFPLAHQQHDWDFADRPASATPLLGHEKGGCDALDAGSDADTT